MDNLFRRISGIYKIQCVVTNKIYIGSSKDIYQRLVKHRHDLNRGTHDSERLQEDYNNYGEESIEAVIIEECSNLVERESYWCRFYNCVGTELGYNKVYPCNGGLKYSYKGSRIICIDRTTGELMVYNNLKEVLDSISITLPKLRRCINYYQAPLSEPTKKGSWKRSVGNKLFILEENYNPDLDYLNFERPRKEQAYRGGRPRKSIVSL